MHPHPTRRARAEDTYETRSTSYDSIRLLKTLQKVKGCVNKTMNVYYSLFHALKDFYLIHHQQDNKRVEDYFHRFEAVQDLIVLSNGKVTDMMKLLIAKQKVKSTASEDKVVQKFLAMVFIKQANPARYKELWRELKNNLVCKQDSYPMLVLSESVHDMLTHWNPRATSGGCMGDSYCNNRNRDQRSPQVGLQRPR